MARKKRAKKRANTALNEVVVDGQDASQDTAVKVAVDLAIGNSGLPQPQALSSAQLDRGVYTPYGPQSNGRGMASNSCSRYPSSHAYGLAQTPGNHLDTAFQQLRIDSARAREPFQRRSPVLQDQAVVQDQPLSHIHPSRLQNIPQEGQSHQQAYGQSQQRAYVKLQPTATPWRTVFASTPTQPAVSSSRLNPQASSYARTSTDRYEQYSGNRNAGLPARPGFSLTRGLPAYATLTHPESRTFRPETLRAVDKAFQTRPFETAVAPPLSVESKGQRSSSPLRYGLPRPEPTHDYLNQATTEPSPSMEPRKLLVILDLNGVLVCRKKRTANFTPRPGLTPFLEYLFANHEVMVWSSAKAENVYKVCSAMFTPEQHQQVKVIWTRSELRLGRFFKDHVQVYKQLSWVFDAFNLVKADRSWLYDQTNVVLIDDSREKAAAEPWNLIEMDEFEAQPHQMNDTALERVVQYLEALRWTADVSQYIYAKPFTVRG